MHRSDTRILTTHAGSLPRPEALTRLYARRVRGQAVDEHLIAAEGRKAVPWIVAEQRKAGIDIISNGEQQRESFVLYLRRRLSGIGGEGDRPTLGDIDCYPCFKARMAAQAASQEIVTNRFHLPKAIGPISYIGQAELNAEIEDFTQALKAEGLAPSQSFFTAASPGILASIVRDEHYGSFERYLAAITSAVRVEYEAIHKADFVLQIDAPDLALERHTSFKHRPVKDFVAFVDQVVAAINSALVNVPRDSVRLHVCWGNYEGPHDQDVPLGDILPSLLKAKAGAIYLPFANPRHAHEYKVLKRIKPAADQVLICGVIDTLTNFVEHPEVVADRLEIAADAMGDPARVVAGTDCGFDTSAGMGRVAEDVVWAKLRAMSDGARIASARLFR